MGTIRKKIDYILKHNRFIYKFFFIIMSNFFKFVGLFIKINNYRVLFTAHSRLYNDSPKVLYEYMINRKEFDKYELIWGLENPNDINIPGRGKKVQIDTLEYFLLALSSKYWITCVNIERGLKFKKEKTIYLNTWHGFPIKEPGYNNDRAEEDLSYIDYFCVFGEFDKQYYKKCFNLSDNNILISGSPRMDELYKTTDEEIINLKKKLNLPLDKKIILYAPTWRDSKDSGKSYILKPPVNINKWEKKLGNDYIVLFRMHPYTNKLLGIQYNEFVRDFSDYPNVNDILKVTDILISDYSGIYIEFSVLERPMLCFGYDLNDYIEERGISMDLDAEFYDGVLKTEDDVINIILNMDMVSEKNATKQFKNKYIQIHANATQICLNALFSK